MVDECPDKWKTSVIVPIFKGKGNVMSCGSYKRVDVVWQVRLSMIQVRHKKRMGTEDLSFYHPNLLCCLDQMLVVMEFLFLFYLPYLSSIHEKANCIAILWTGSPHSLGSFLFRGLWATCLPHKGGASR